MALNNSESFSQADIDAAMAAAQSFLDEPEQQDVPATAPAAAPAPAAPPSAALFAAMDEPETGGGYETRNLDVVMDIPLEISVELGRKKMSIRSILDLGSGSIVELDKVAGEPVDLFVNGRMVARGEVVVIEDNFGVRITEIVGRRGNDERTRSD